MASTLILVDDDPLLLQLLSQILQPAGFICVTASDVAQAERMARRHPPQAAIVDIQLGQGESGLALVRAWRDERQFPVIVLSAQGSAVDRIAGLETGAEDYIVKPVEPRELVLRVTRVIERFNYLPAVPSAQARWTLGRGMLFDPMQRALVSPEITVLLSSAEFKLLSHLLKNVQQAVSREQILTAVHQRLQEAQDRSVDMLVARLRKKLAASGMQIQAIRGTGYMLTGPARRL